MNCKICDSRTTDFGETKVMGKYRASYRRCQRCGFIFVADPYWTSEAYTHAITATDMGTVSRTDRNSLLTKAVIDLFYHSSSRFLDYGAGYGMFVRRMRDLGYNFYAYDMHCRNMFSEQFALLSFEECQFDLTTAFEVFEHLEEPLKVTGTLWAHTDHLLVTTELLPDPVPNLGDWWYYAPEHGQHVSFFTFKALEEIASAGGRFLYTNGVNLHLFSRKRLNRFLFRRATTERASQWIGLWKRRRSLLEDDWQRLRAEVLENLGYQAK